MSIFDKLSVNITYYF